MTAGCTNQSSTVGDSVAEVTDGRVRLWSRGGHDWAPKLPELESLAGLGDVVLDGEMIVATPDGRADFELLTTRLNRRPGDPTPAPPVSLYVFDILRHQGQDLRDRPWSERRAILDGLELAEHTAGVARPTVVSPDGNAMHQATADIGAEGTVSKDVRSVYRAGRSRRWLKTKHSRVHTFQVGGWRPSTSSRPGGLILVEDDDPVAVATLALADKDRQDLVDLLHKYGRQHPTGTVTIPDDCLTATVRYTSRTPTHGHLREAFVLAVHPAGEVLMFRPVLLVSRQRQETRTASFGDGRRSRLRGTGTPGSLSVSAPYWASPSRPTSRRSGLPGAGGTPSPLWPPGRVLRSGR